MTVCIYAPRAGRSVRTGKMRAYVFSCHETVAEAQRALKKLRAFQKGRAGPRLALKIAPSSRLKKATMFKRSMENRGRLTRKRRR